MAPIPDLAQNRPIRLTIERATKPYVFSPHCFCMLAPSRVEFCTCCSLYFNPSQKCLPTKLFTQNGDQHLSRSISRCSAPQTRCSETGQGQTMMILSSDTMARSLSTNHEQTVLAVCTIIWKLGKTSSPTFARRENYIPKLVC